MKKKKKSGRETKKSGKNLAGKTGLAIKQEFYLEAAWMLSSILEKKLKKALERIENHNPGTGYSLEQSVKRVKHLHLKRIDPHFSDRFEISLIDEIRIWKNQRNTILKDMQDVHVSKARFERLAFEGIRLLKEWNRANKKFKEGSAPGQEIP